MEARLNDGITPRAARPEFVRSNLLDIQRRVRASERSRARPWRIFWLQLRVAADLFW
jgi:hypothetical protein